MNTELYPLIMKPLYKEKVWGGQSLRKLLGKELPADRKIGELWEISDFYKDQSIVANGPLAGMSLHDAINKWGTDLLGTKVKLLDNGLFPLLIKYINANKDLSVQVHPTDAYARAHNLQQPGKTECWYVINAEPGGRLIAGFKEGVTRESFIKSIDNGTIAEQLHEIPVQTGDVLFIPAGRIHAIGAGVTLFEVQQNADITYRIYDWDRPDLNGKPRELHISQALEVCDFNDHEPKLEPQHVSYNGEEIMCPVIDCEYFTITHRTHDFFTVI